MKARILGVIVLFISYYNICLGQNYFFSVPSVLMEAHVQPDGGAILRYRMVFQNSPTGHTIDVIDVGLPTEDYDAGSMKASRDGQPVAGPIRASQYVQPGVEVHLGN